MDIKTFLSPELRKNIVFQTSKKSIPFNPIGLEYLKDPDQIRHYVFDSKIIYVAELSFFSKEFFSSFLLSISNDIILFLTGSDFSFNTSEMEHILLCVDTSISDLLYDLNDSINLQRNLLDPLYTLTLTQPPLKNILELFASKIGGAIFLFNSDFSLIGTNKKSSLEDRQFLCRLSESVKVAHTQVQDKMAFFSFKNKEYYLFKKSIPEKISYLLIEITETVTPKIDLLVETLCTFLNQNFNKAQYESTDLFSEFVDELLKRNLEDYELQFYLNTLPNKLLKHYTWIVISIRRKINHQEKTEMLSSLTKIFQSQNVAVNNQNFYILFSSNERRFTTEIIDDFSKFLVQHNAYASIGNFATKLIRMRAILVLLKPIVRLGLLLEDDFQKRIFYFGDYSLFAIIDFYAQYYNKAFPEADLAYFAHPVIVELYRYDAKNKTNLFEIFKIYLKNNGNITKASKELYMHRNTLLQKIKLISSLTDLDINDTLLQSVSLISYQLIDYIEKTSKNKFKLTEDT